MDLAAGAMRSLLPKLDELLGDEVKKRVRKEVLSLKAVLETIHAALGAVEGVLVDHLQVRHKEWTREAMDLAYDLERVVDKFRASQLRAAAPPPTVGPSGCIAKIPFNFNQATAKARRQFATDLRRFKHHMEDLAGRLPLPIDAVPSRPPPVEPDDHVNVNRVELDDADKLVGLDGPVDDVVKILTEGEEEGSTSSRQLKVASIVGMGGSGKTTLAAQVYQRLAPEFHCRAWVCLSVRPDMKNVFSSILRQVSQQEPAANFGSIQETEIIARIRESLKDKRYLIVVDDVWETESWNALKCALTENSNGSAVIMTSRIMELARYAGHVYKLGHLSDFYARQLFYKRLFGSEDNCPPELAEISDKILEKCKGLPLAITTIVSLLAGKTMEGMHTTLSRLSEIERPRHDMRSIFNVAYAYLPHHIRSCLLYLSMFGEDYKMSVDRLVWGWMAEGFIPRNEIMTLQEQGEEYIRQLINRSLIIPVEVDTDGKALSCRIHDLVREFIVSLSAETNFSTIIDGQHSRPMPEKVHRLSIQGNKVEQPLPELSCVRSLVVSGDANLMPSLSEFQNLRVLDLGGCDSLQNDHLKDIESSFPLICLIVGGNCITAIPKEIGNLVFLQTLDLRATSVKELPASIVQARHLKYLRVNRHTKIPDGVFKLECLEELGDINISKPELLKELCSLTKLTVLGIAIWSWDESYDDALLGYMRSLAMKGPNIQSLTILTCCSLDFLDELDAKKWAPPRLGKLELRHVALVAMPRWICSVEHLSSLSIQVHKLSEKMIDMLGQLHNLCSLSLTSKHAPEPEARFSSKCTGGFIKLTSFRFVSNAMRKIFEAGAMLKLKMLKLSFEASRTKDVSPGFDFGLENLSSSLEQVDVKIICTNASLLVVEGAEASIKKAIRSDAKHNIQRVREEDMVDEGEEVLQIVEDIKSPEECYPSSGSADGNVTVTPDPCVGPNANKIDEARLLSQLMIENMHLRLQLLNNDFKVKGMMRDTGLYDNEIVLAARDCIEDLMKQVLNEIGSGPAGWESSSTAGKLNRKGPHMDHHNTQNVSNEKESTREDNQTTIVQLDTSETSQVLVHIEDVCIPKEIIEILTKEFPQEGPEKYLDDKLINASIYCLRHKYPSDTRDEGSVFLEKTEICQLLHRDGKHAMFKGAIEKGENMKSALNYLNHDMIFLPLHCGQHWYLAVVNARHHEIQVLDSLSSRNTEREELKLTLKGIETYLKLATDEEPTRTNSWPDHEVTKWKVRLVQGLPRQEDSSSCGLFMLKYMEYWTGSRLSMKFTQDDINKFRGELASMLVNSPLNKIINNKEH